LKVELKGYQELICATHRRCDAMHTNCVAHARHPFTSQAPRPHGMTLSGHAAWVKLICSSLGRCWRDPRRGCCR
jgi:hypothetical protein